MNTNTYDHIGYAGWSSNLQVAFIGNPEKETYNEVINIITYYRSIVISTVRPM